MRGDQGNSAPLPTALIRKGVDKSGMERRGESDRQTDDRVTFGIENKNATQEGMPHGSPTQCHKRVPELTVCRQPGSVP